MSDEVKQGVTGMTCDNGAECSVLGAMMLDRHACSVAEDLLDIPGGAFGNAANQMIFDAIVDLSHKMPGDNEIDIVVLANHLKEKNILEKVGGAGYLSHLMQETPSSANIDHYVSIVKRFAILRKAESVCMEGLVHGKEYLENPHAFVDMIGQKIGEIERIGQNSDYKHIRPAIEAAMNEVFTYGAQAKAGIPTGFGTLDRAMFGGLKPGMLFILAARPAIGKTALAMNMAVNIAMSDPAVNVGIFSLEMISNEIAIRMVSSLSRVDFKSWKYVDSIPEGESKFVQDAWQKLVNLGIYIDDTGGIDIMELRSKARRMVMKHKVKVIFIDYLQLITTKGKKNSTRENDVSHISGALKALAKELGITVVALSQLSRSAEGSRPVLSNLRESGAIEQDADVVALLHRERSENHSDVNQPSSAELIIAKNRAGENTVQNLAFFPKFTLFEPRQGYGDADDKSFEDRMNGYYPRHS